jgi:hypothetical protein
VAKPRDLERGVRGRDDELRRERAALTPDERDDRPRAHEGINRDDGRELGARSRRDLDAPKARDDKEPFAKGRDADEERPRALGRGRRELDDRAAAKPLDREERAPRAGRDAEREPGGRSRREPTREPELTARPARRELDDTFEAPRTPARARDLDERPVRSRARDDDREPARLLRDEPPRGRRDLDVEERAPARARGRDDERFESRTSERTDSERAARGRSVDAPPPRPAAKRAAPVEEPIDDGFAPPVGTRSREDRTERDRPSRVRARARNRERVRELEREREQD